jgi:branched-chain amino acid transport system substrate-binding protein
MGFAPGSRAQQGPSLRVLTDDADLYAPSAIVRASGDVEELNGRAGLRLLRTHPALVNWVRTFLGTTMMTAQFFCEVDADVWLRVRIDRQDASLREPEAVVTLIHEKPPYGLTHREVDVLTLMTGGLSNREIAARLVTGTRTIATHVEHIFEKTEVSSRAAAAVLATEQGILRLPIPGGAAGISLTIARLDQSAPAVPVISRTARSDVPATRLGRRPYTIGSVFPLHGPASADGIEMRNGSALAIAEIASSGGIAGRPIRQVVVDTDIFSPDGIRKAFAALVDAEVDAITAGYFFAEDEARELAADYGAPFLHAMTSEAQVQHVRDSGDTYGRIFQVCPSEVHYGNGFIRFLDDLVGSRQWVPPNRRLAFIETPVPGGLMANKSTFDNAERSGWTIERCDLVPTIGADWDGVVAGLRQMEPAAILIAQFLPGELAAFLRRLALERMDALVYAVYAPSIPDFLRLAGDAAEGLLWSTMSGTYSDPFAMSFNHRYGQAFGQPPGRSNAGIAYDEVHLLANAWAAVGNPRNFDAVAAQLRRATYRGVNGSYSLDNGGQCGLAYPDVTLDPSLGQAHLVFQIQAGEHRILSPLPYAEARFRSPDSIPPASTHVDERRNYA